MTHLNTNNLLVDSHFRFRQNRCCILQLLKVADEQSREIDKNKQIDCVNLDFQKAFDTVPHRRLIKKFESFGICGNILNWISNFLSYRKQRVVLDRTFSEWKAVIISGIPPGSDSGPVFL